MKKRIWDTVEKDYYKLYFISICIAGMSILMITSATYSESGMFYVSRQLIFILVGVMLMVIGAHFNILIFLFKHSKAVYIIAVILLLLLKSSLGVSSHGATRWLRIPFIQIQPVEVMKFGLIVLLARFIYKYHKFIGSFKMTIYCWIFGIIPALLTLKLSSDLSSSLVILGITFGLTLSFNKTIRFQVPIFIMIFGVIFGYILYINNNLPDVQNLSNYSYRVVRIAAWLHPEQYPDIAYQTQSALYGIGSAGLMGVGLGKNYVLIPEEHTDFIFALLTHQLGIFGGLGLILAYAYMLFQIMKIAINATSIYDTILATGIFIHIALQVVINICVATSLFPNTGLPLPIMSYGGSSTLMTFMELGICVSISKKSVLKYCNWLLLKNKGSK